jgi:hypothetical protein
MIKNVRSQKEVKSLKRTKLALTFNNLIVNIGEPISGDSK